MSSKITFRPSKPIIISKESSGETSTNIQPLEPPTESKESPSQPETSTATNVPLTTSPTDPSSTTTSAPSTSTTNIKRKRAEEPIEEEIKKKDQVQNSLKASRTFGEYVSITNASFSDITKKYSDSIFNNNDAATTEFDNSTDTNNKVTDSNVSVPIETITGEENDLIICKTRCSLKAYDTEKKEWKQRGSGVLHLSISSTKESSFDITDLYTRVIVRYTGTMSLLLNAKLFDEMDLRRSGERSIIIGVLETLDDKPIIRSIAIQMDTKNSAEYLYELMSKLKSKQGLQEYYNDNQLNFENRNLTETSTNEADYGGSKEEEDEDQDDDDYYNSERQEEREEYVSESEGQFDVYYP